MPTYDILATYPELENILLKLQGTINVEVMQRMNYIADDLMVEPTRVAEEFLKENNYFEEKEPYVEPVGKGGQV